MAARCGPPGGGHLASRLRSSYQVRCWAPTTKYHVARARPCLVRLPPRRAGGRAGGIAPDETRERRDDRRERGEACHDARLALDIRGSRRLRPPWASSRRRRRRRRSSGGPGGPRSGMNAGVVQLHVGFDRIGHETTRSSRQAGELSFVPPHVRVRASRRFNSRSLAGSFIHW